MISKGIRCSRHAIFKECNKLKNSNNLNMEGNLIAKVQNHEFINIVRVCSYDYVNILGFIGKYAFMA